MTNQISPQNKDIVLKVMVEHFKDKNLELFGLKTAKIKGLAPTELPAVEAKEKRTDVVFLLKAIIIYNCLRVIIFFAGEIYIL